jgi:maleylacetate reductase
MRACDDHGPGPRVRFGVGRALEIVDEGERLDLGRVLLVATGSATPVADRLERRLGRRLAARWSDVEQHVPVTLVERARARADAEGVDGVLSVGGGSAIGLGKAVVLGTDRVLLALPTTYSGSEMTPIYGITAARKQTGRDPSVVPRAVVYDPALTVGLPVGTTVTSAMNALAHAVEALYGAGAGPTTDRLSVGAIRCISRALPRVVRSPGDLDARGELLLGAHRAGAALALVGTGLHHTACHVLGGTFGLGHAEVHAVLLPHVVAFQAAIEPAAIAKVAAALGLVDPAAGLFDLVASAGGPTSLRSLGLREEALPSAARELAIAMGPADGRAGVDALERLLRQAWSGHRPLAPMSARTAVE